VELLFLCLLFSVGRFIFLLDVYVLFVDGRPCTTPAAWLSLSVTFLVVGRACVEAGTCGVEGLEIY
jgi:hypothetical protein